MNSDYRFTGIGSASDDGAGLDPDSITSLHQESEGPGYTSNGDLDQASSADQIVRSMCRECASQQGGTNFDNDVDEIASQCPERTEAEDLVSGPYYDEIPGTDCWESQRTWHESDNTGEPPELDWETHAAKVDRVVKKKP
jgi:hypothetical protein